MAFVVGRRRITPDMNSFENMEWVECIKFVGLWMQMDGSFDRQRRQVVQNMEQAAHNVSILVAKTPGLDWGCRRELHIAVVRGAGVYAGEV